MCVSCSSIMQLHDAWGLMRCIATAAVLCFNFSNSKYSVHKIYILNNVHSLQSVYHIYLNAKTTLISDDPGFNDSLPFSGTSSIPLCYVLFLPPFPTNYSSILSHPILPSISWSTSQFVVPKFIYNTLLGILFSSILCTRPNQRNLFNLIVSTSQCRNDK